MRVNARLDTATQEQLEYLMRATGQGVSEVVRESLARYHALVLQQRQPASRFLAMAGKWSSGHTDTASNVKAVVAEYLDAKYPQHSRGSNSAAPTLAAKPAMTRAKRTKAAAAA